MRQIELLETQIENLSNLLIKETTKLDNLNELLACQSDIASTHALFKKLDEDSRENIKNGKYSLILDEVLNVIEPYDDIRNDDMKLLKDSGV